MNGVDFTIMIIVHFFCSEGKCGCWSFVRDTRMRSNGYDHLVHILMQALHCIDEIKFFHFASEMSFVHVFLQVTYH